MWYTRAAIASVAVLALVGGTLLLREMLDPNMRGPRGYYVQDEDPSVYIEFFEKPRARSNLVKSFGDADYWFSAFDSEIHIGGPTTATKDRQIYFEIDGDGTDIVVSHKSEGVIPGTNQWRVTHYTRKGAKKPNQISEPTAASGRGSP